jgi:hypothetical protein
VSDYKEFWWLCFVEVRRGVSSRRTMKCAWGCITWEGQREGKRDDGVGQGHSSEEGGIGSRVSCDSVSP